MDNQDGNLQNAPIDEVVHRMPNYENLTEKTRQGMQRTWIIEHIKPNEKQPCTKGIFTNEEVQRFDAQTFKKLRLNPHVCDINKALLSRFISDNLRQQREEKQDREKEELLKNLLFDMNEPNRLF